VPHGEDSLARCFAGTNLVYTQYVNRKQDRSGRLWQNRFFSCPVDKDEYLWPVLRYIERNPVRVGLVRKAWQYQWSSAGHHATGEADPLLNEPAWLGEEMARRKYRDYLREDSAEQTTEIRRMTARGRPLGGRMFAAALESRLGRSLLPRQAGRRRRTTE